MIWLQTLFLCAPAWNARSHTVNLPNLLTLSRIPILFGIVGLLYAPFPGASTIAFILFVIGALTDWADGYFARKQGLVSNFGKLMDALTDKVFMVGLFIALLAMNVLQGWALPMLLLILSREFLITGLRLVAASSGIVLAAEKSLSTRRCRKLSRPSCCCWQSQCAAIFRLPVRVGDLLLGWWRFLSSPPLDGDIRHVI